jgi:hypothetical protein
LTALIGIFIAAAYAQDDRRPETSPAPATPVEELPSLPAESPDSEATILVQGELKTFDVDDRTLVVAVGPEPADPNPIDPEAEEVVRGVRTLDLDQGIDDGDEVAPPPTQDLRTLFVPVGTPIFRSGEAMQFQDLKSGDKVRVLCDALEPATALRIVVEPEDDADDETKVKVEIDVEGRVPRRAERPHRGSVTIVEGHPWMGAVVVPTPADDLLVTQVQPGSPAAQAGLMVNDFIVMLENQRPPTIRVPTELGALVKERKIGDTISITVWRNGSRQHLQVLCGQQPPAGTQPLFPVQPPANSPLQSFPPVAVPGRIQT